MNPSPGKILLLLGLALAFFGLLLLLFDRTGTWQNLWQRLPLGRLPGDITFKRDGFSFSFPWVTCLVISVVLSLLVALFRK